MRPGSRRLYGEEVDAAAPTLTGVWAPERRRLTSGLVLTITLVAFEALAISTVLPVVSDDLGGLGLYGWVFSGFFLGSLLGIVAAGQLADSHGTALPFAAGLVLFTVGLVAGGLAPSMGLLVAARVAQGVGAGAIPAVAYASVGRAYPPALRPRVFAVFSSAWVVPGLVGPAASSAIAGWLGWRAVFLALLPFVALAAAITLPALTRVADPVGDHHGPVEELPQERGTSSTGSRWWSSTAGAAAQRRAAVALTVGVAAVLLALNGPPPLLAAALAVVGLPLALRSFVRIVPAGTLRLAPGIPAAIAVKGLLTFAFFGADAYVSLAFQEVRDQPTWVAGIALTATTVSWTAAAWVQERVIHRTGPRWLVRRGFLLVLVGTLGMLAVLGPVPIPLAVAVWSVAGFGIGLAYSPISVTVLGLASAGREGEASASVQLCDVLGTALGTGAAGALVALGDAQGWATRDALELAFALMALVAIGGALAARRLPTVLPG
jgi:MFS family permease